MINHKDKMGIWNSSPEEIDNLYESITNKYVLKYKYKNNFKMVETYIKKLVLTSLMNNGNNPAILKYIEKVEDFICYSYREGFITKDNINNIMNVLNNEFKTLDFLPLEKRGLYGRSYGDIIEINPSLNERRTTLYMIHEIGHKILNVANYSTAVQFTNSFDNIMKSKGANYSYIKYPDYPIFCGFLMLEEALTQEMGEIITSKIYKYERKPLTYDSNLGINFKTNFDFYGLFQQPTIEFGKTLRGVGGKNKDESIILRDMIKKALNSKDGFSIDVVKEYYAADHNVYLSLYYMLGNMGNILNEKYGSFGERMFPSMNIPLKTSQQRIYDYAKKCYDYRLEPEEGFPNINFIRKMK